MKSLTTCPKCLRDYKEYIEGFRNKVNDAYGKVPQIEFLRLKKCLEGDEKTRIPGQTLQQEYTIGVNKQGVFSVSYSCSCSQCGYTRDFGSIEEFGNKRAKPNV